MVLCQGNPEPGAYGPCTSCLPGPFGGWPCPSLPPSGDRVPFSGNVQQTGQTPRKATAGDAWGCLTPLPPSTYVCSPSGCGQGQSRACSHKQPHLWASPGRCGHSHGLCSCSSYPLGRDRQERGWGPGREKISGLEEITGKMSQANVVFLGCHWHVHGMHTGVHLVIQMAIPWGKLRTWCPGPEPGLAQGTVNELAGPTEETLLTWVRLQGMGYRMLPRSGV